MNRYRLVMTIEDEAEGRTPYEAFLTFRDRFKAGFYGPPREDIEFVEEVEEPPTSTPEES
ncbi:hypothetical protein ES708_11547 [subsurface metagenome]